jgi:PAS domain-containing protein
LLTLPAMPGSGAMLMGAHGVVHAAVGVLAEHLGATLTPEQANAAGQLRQVQAIGVSGLSIVVVVPAGTAAGDGLMIGLGALGLVGLLGAGLLVRNGRRQQQAATGAKAQAAMAQAALREALDLLASQDRRMEQILAGLDLGACLLDSQMRLVAWNDSFPGLAGVAPQALRPGLLAQDVDLAPARPEETAIRAALRHRLGDMQDRRNGSAMRFRPDGSQVQDKWTTLEDGGLLLTCRLEAEPEQALASRPSPLESLAEMCAEELRKRLPLVLAAASTADLESLRMEAHAMRGVAANFGLEVLAEAIAVMERAAKAGRLAEMRRAAEALPAQTEAALASLFSRAA